MAGGGDSNEMNPFISYVDLFASIIMVLLLFILIMFVNVGYYIQFNSKDKSEKEQTPTEQEKKKKENLAPELKKEENKEKIVQFYVQNENNNTTPVQGGEVEGNSLSKKSEQFAQAEFKEQELIIAFKNNEFFLNKEITTQVIDFMRSIIKKSPNALFYISVNDSQKLISSTQTKQVSLGRLLSLKNALEKEPELQNKIKLNYKQTDSLNYEFGCLKIDVK